MKATITNVPTTDVATIIVVLSAYSHNLFTITITLQQQQQRECHQKLEIRPCLRAGNKFHISKHTIGMLMFNLTIKNLQTQNTNTNLYYYILSDVRNIQ